MRSLQLSSEVTHALLQRLQRLDRRRADDPFHRGLGRNDVGLVATLGDDAVDSLGRTDVLAHRGNVHVPEHRGVECVATLPRRGSGVGGLAVVLHMQFLQRDRVHRDQVGVGRVHHHRRVDLVECAVPGHADLAPAALFGRGAHDPQRASGLLGDDRRRQTGAEPGGGDHVVAAGVTDPGQRVVFAQHRDVEARLADRRPRTLCRRRRRAAVVVSPADRNWSTSRSWAKCSSKFNSG